MSLRRVARKPESLITTGFVGIKELKKHLKNGILNLPKHSINTKKESAFSKLIS